MAVGDVIKRLRLSHKLSQSELGKIAGVTDKAVSTWEKGEKVPRMGSIEKMATYFGVSKGYLIEMCIRDSCRVVFKPCSHISEFLAHIN